MNPKCEVLIAAVLFLLLACVQGQVSSSIGTYNPSLYMIYEFPHIADFLAGLGQAFGWWSCPGILLRTPARQLQDLQRNAT